MRATTAGTILRTRIGFIVGLLTRNFGSASDLLTAVINSAAYKNENILTNIAAKNQTTAKLDTLTRRKCKQQTTE